MESLGQPATGHHPSSEFVDQDNFAAANNVILVPLEKLVRAQTLIDVVHDGRAFRIVQGLPFGQQAGRNQLLLKRIVAFVGEGHLPRLFLNLVVGFVQIGDQRIN